MKKRIRKQRIPENHPGIFPDLRRSDFAVCAAAMKILLCSLKGRAGSTAGPAWISDCLKQDAGPHSLY